MYIFIYVYVYVCWVRRKPFYALIKHPKCHSFFLTVDLLHQHQKVYFLVVSLLKVWRAFVGCCFHDKNQGLWKKAFSQETPVSHSLRKHLGEVVIFQQPPYQNAQIQSFSAKSCWWLKPAIKLRLRSGQESPLSMRKHFFLFIRTLLDFFWIKKVVPPKQGFLWQHEGKLWFSHDFKNIHRRQMETATATWWNAESVKHHPQHGWRWISFI